MFSVMVFIYINIFINYIINNDTSYFYYYYILHTFFVCKYAGLLTKPRTSVVNVFFCSFSDLTFLLRGIFFLSYFYSYLYSSLFIVYARIRKAITREGVGATEGLLAEWGLWRKGTVCGGEAWSNTVFMYSAEALSWTPWANCR